MNGFILFSEDAGIINRLDDIQRGRLLSALYGYANGEEYAPIDPVTDIIFEVLRVKIDKGNAEYEKKRAARKNAAEKRWNANDANASNAMQSNANDANASNAMQTMLTNQTKPNQTKPNQTKPNQTNPNVYQDKHRVFIPPTAEDVRAYCDERGNSVDPDHFIDYYTSNGWMVGKSRMKDWRAAVRNWERTDAPRQRGKPPEGGGINWDEV